MANSNIKPNNTANVSVGTGVKGGYAYRAPIGTPLPSRYDTTAADLHEDFVNLGYVSEDGINNPIETDGENFKDMNGDTIDHADSEYTETIVLTLAEQMKASLAMEYGEDNVIDEEGQIVARHRSDPKEHCSLVLLLVLKNGRRQTTVVPDCQVTEVGEKKYAKTDLVGRELTATCYPDANGDHVIDYIESTETASFDKEVKIADPVLSEPFGGKTLSDLVGEDYKIQRTGDAIKASGTVYQVDNWDAYPKAEQNKYYPVIRFVARPGTKIKTQTLAGKDKEIVLKTGEDDIIVAIDKQNPKRSFTLIDPNDEKLTVQLEFDASACNFTTKE